MSSVEEKAKELFPLLQTDKIGNNPYITYNTEQLAKQEGFVKGYHQAEKDIGDPISWIKEISGEKEMTRAKEEALKAYPPRSIAANYDTIARRDAFEYGYLKAEKDLKLTWEDIKEICVQSVLVEIDLGGLVSDERHYSEVLKRFNKERKEK